VKSRWIDQGEERVKLTGIGEMMEETLKAGTRGGKGDFIGPQNPSQEEIGECQSCQVLPTTCMDQYSWRCLANTIADPMRVVCKRLPWLYM
jgi:hypothetical protein